MKLKFLLVCWRALDLVWTVEPKARRQKVRRWITRRYENHPILKLYA